MSCRIDNDSGEFPEFFRSKVVVAKKTHKCGECYAGILVGEKYERSVGKWDGSFNTHSTCSSCVEIRDHFFDHYCFECLWDDLGECVEDITLKDLDELTPEAVGKLEGKFQERWDELWEDEVVNDY
jgi:hypothetical protein